MTLGIAAARVDDDETVAVIRDVYERYGYLIDPHTAVGGIGAVRKAGQRRRGAHRR